jgi:hypothetical protein
MAIKDIQEQLIKSEGQSGEFLIKKIKTDLDAVYNAGYEGEQTAVLDSYWKEARDEFFEEASKAVKKGKSKEAKEKLKDLEVFQKSLEATEEISGSGIGAGTMAMLAAVKPHIEVRAKTLSKNEGIFKSMKKKAIGSAVGAVEGFASSLLAPLPFGAGEAIIEKTKGFLGAGKGDKAERQTEQAVSFAGRIEREGESGGGAGGGGAGGGGAGGGGAGGNGDGLGGEVVLERLDSIVDLLQRGLFRNPPFLETMNEKLEDLIGVSKPDRETAREEEREDDREHKETIDAMKKAGGVGVAGLAGEDGGGFLSSLLGTALGTGGIPGVGGFFGKNKGGKGLQPRNAKGQFMKAGGKGAVSNLFKGPALKNMLSMMIVPLMSAITPMLAFLVSPPGLIALAVAATAGGLWWAGSKLLEEKSSEDLTKELEKVKSTKAVAAGRVTLAQAETFKENREKSLEEDIVEAKKRESGGGGTTTPIRKNPKTGLPMRHEGGPIKGPPGSESVYKLTAGERVFDNESSEKIERAASLLEGTDFKSMTEFKTAGKDSAGFNILMDKFFTSGMLESKHGGMLKNTAMLFGLAGHGQMGKRDFLGSQVDQFSMGPETIERLFERLSYFKERTSKQKERSSETGSRWTKGRERNLNELNAVRAIQEISKSLALWGDSPEELAAIERHDKMSTEERMLDQAPREVWDKRGNALQIDLKRRWDGFAQSERDRTGRIDASMAKSFDNRGKALNNAAYDKVGLNGQGNVINAQTFNAPTTVSNNTITPKRLPSPNFGGRVGEGDKFLS